MKTLVVLSALVAAAIAAPALLEDGNENHGVTQLQFPYRRDRKSTDSKNDQIPIPGTLPHPAQPLNGQPRSFLLKKPIIVKKKEGYHVYRDSDEEQADSRETCVKEVKVKLCDDLSKGEVARAIEDSSLLMSEDEMKHSIKMAKEAVENIQRDLQKAERSSVDSALKHDHSESDTELHHDIEVARQALEHIHQNFGNLESMSLHATVKDAEIKDNNQFTIAKSEEQRLIQWKEALENINRNAEIVRSIEDSFKVNEPREMFSEDAEVADSKMRNAEDIKTIENDNMTPKSSEIDNINAHLFDDMNTSPSIAVETKTLAGDNESIHLFKNAVKDENVETKLLPEAKSAEMEVSSLNQSPNIENRDMTTVMVEKERKPESESLKKHEDLTESLSKMKSAELESIKNLEETLKTENIQTIDKKAKSAETEWKSLENGQEKSAIDTTMFVKAAEQDKEVATAPHNLVDKEGQSIAEVKMAEGEAFMAPSLSSDSLALERDAKPNKKAIDYVDDEHHGVTKDQEGQKHPDGSQQQKNEHEPQTHSKMANVEQLTNMETSHHEVAKMADVNVPINNEQVNNEHFGKMASDVPTQQQHQQQGKMADFELLPGSDQTHHRLQQLRTMPDFDRLSNIDQLHHQHTKMANTDLPTNLDQSRWAHDNQMQMTSMKVAEEMPKDAVETMNTHEFSGHHHHMEHIRHPTGAHLHAHPHSHSHHGRFHDNFMTQGKSADMDSMQPTYYMRDTMKSGTENRFRWMPSHETPRSSYGAPAASVASSGGAVGLFPNANVGGCGIPLLLSCNPSVVSGSLAKAHSTYAAPAYRSEDEFQNFLAKRDIKTNEKMNRTPTLTKTKTTTLAIKQ